MSGSERWIGCDGRVHTIAVENAEDPCPICLRDWRKHEPAAPWPRIKVEAMPEAVACWFRAAGAEVTAEGNIEVLRDRARDN